VRYALLYDVGLILGGSVLVALSAQWAVPLPFSPIPITGQTLAVLLVGALLGARRGSLCVLTYLLEGCAGLPVFAGARAGLGVLFGPTGGYLLGFVAAAWVSGWLAERGWDRRTGTAFLAMALGNVIIYAFGLAWLSRFVGGGHVLELGFLPFVPGDILKLILGTLLLPAGWRLLGHRGKAESGAIP
jgi:biotin transport system substrate-specific component